MSEQDSSQITEQQTTADHVSGLRRRNLLKSAVSMAAAGAMAPILGSSVARASSNTDITAMSALELSTAIKNRAVSCEAVMTAYIQRIERVNPSVNAIVSLGDSEALIAQAKTADRELDRGQYRGWMHGFPHAVKDLANAEGFITSQGSPLYKDTVAAHDDLMVKRIKDAGAIVIGKTNVPEFGLGSNSYNPVFGATLNPFDSKSTAGGSSGGAAAALSANLVPVADGSDLMGSLRNPAAFCNVIGFRPTPGRVPLAPLFIEELPCNGPMGRTVSDTAMLLSSIAGYDPTYPSTIPEDPWVFSGPLARDWKGTKIGWLGDFNGYLPMESGLLECNERAFAHFEAIGCAVDNATIEFPMEKLWEIWLTFRHWLVRGLRTADYADPARRALLKPECIWEIEGGLKLTAQNIFMASVGRAKFYAALLKVFEKFDYLALPATQVFPFDASIHWPKEIAGKTMDTYHRWMEVVVPGTLSGCPVAAVPTGFSDKGLPCGIQIIGPRLKDFATLQLAYAYEQAARYNLDIKPNL